MGGEMGCLCFRLCSRLANHSRWIAASPLVLHPHPIPAPEKFCWHAGLHPVQASLPHPSNLGGHLPSARETFCHQWRQPAPDGNVLGQEISIQPTETFHAGWGGTCRKTTTHQTLFNAFHVVNTLHYPIGTTSVHGARARLGLRGSLVGPKVAENEFFRNCS